MVYLIWKTEISESYKYISATLLILFSLLIGFSRVYLRLHYPTDVFAGFCLVASYHLCSPLKKENRRGATCKKDVTSTVGSIGIRFIHLPAMVTWLYKLLFVAITFSFFVSSTEMDLGDCHNTFFDEYDVYVKTEQVSLDHSTVEQQVHNTYALIRCDFFYFQSLGQQQRPIAWQTKDYNTDSPPKLFLKNSVWRIWYNKLNLEIIAPAIT